jgi:hypothetical protein
MEAAIASDIDYKWTNTDVFSWTLGDTDTYV